MLCSTEKQFNSSLKLHHTTHGKQDLNYSGHSNKVLSCKVCLFLGNRLQVLHHQIIKTFHHSTVYLTNIYIYISEVIVSLKCEGLGLR